MSRGNFIIIKPSRRKTELTQKSTKSVFRLLKKVGIPQTLGLYENHADLAESDKFGKVIKLWRGISNYYDRSNIFIIRNK